MRKLNHKQTLIQFIRKLREGVYITSASGDIIDCNRAFLEMLGVCSLQELQGLKAQNLLMDPCKREEELDILEKNGNVREFELALRRPDGRVRYVLDTAYRVEDPATGEMLYHGILVDITERKLLERQLREQAIRDPLTGCYNRRYLREIIAAYEASSEAWGVVVADMDYFKECNDRHGHAYGDRVLVQIGRFLAREVRAEDPVFRTGGDEFMVFMPGLARQATREAADRLRRNGPLAAPASFSLGWAAREDSEDIEETMRRADLQLIRVRVQERGLHFQKAPRKFA